MSQPPKPNGDHIITIDPNSPSAAEIEKLSRKSATYAKRDSSEVTAPDARQKKNTENANLDGGQTEKTKFQRFKPLLWRLLLLIVPGALFAIPIIVGFTYGDGRDAHIGGVWLRWFFIWVEIFWCSIWISSITTKYILPHVARIAIGLISKKAKKYRYVIAELEVPLTLLGWSFASFISFHPIMYGYDPLESRVNWRGPTQQVLAGFLVTAVIYLVKSVMIQIVYIRYRQAQLADKVTKNKESIELLTKLYAKSRDTIPDDADARLREDDAVLAEAITFSVTNFAIDSKNPEEEARWAEASARVIWALEHKKTAGQSLAKRIWNTFVRAGETSLYPVDLEPHFTKEPDVVARSFAILDKDDNGDITLEEMILDVTEIARERKDLYSGWSDSQDIVRNFSILCNVVVVALGILVFLAFLTSIKNTFGYAATVLASLGFAFNGTITEMFSAIIFIFVKHPFDVGDCVDVDHEEYIVEHISLLYTQVRNVSNSKYTHFPNSVLNSKTVENVSRSKAMHEVFTISVSYDTTDEDIDTLRSELRKFIEENSRDFFTREEDLFVEMSGFALDKIEVKIQIRYKGNYADGKRPKRKAMVLRELLRLTRLIPIFAPGGGYAALGSGDNPTFGVAISPEDARLRIDAFGRDKEEKRMRRVE
ncbi:hypothetical protein ABW19_dt0208265 [Dactylella cylindrospora]|nr:hypothetical protein ABW19_dt0208265 [Dactylella cylindrospora]